MTEWNELVDMDATAQAELVRKKEVKPIELVEATVERIEKLNSTLNAVVTPMYEQARKQASGSISDGSFAGVPFLLKDFLAEYAGVRFTEGTSFLGDYVPKEDSELIRRYKSAGLIFVRYYRTPSLWPDP
jgi:amidase